MIVYCCADLLFSTKIGSTAQALGTGSRPARDAQALRNRLERIDDGKLNEPVTAVMIDLDLGQLALELIALAKGHDAALPVVAFGSHVATELLAEARKAGADFVLPRSRFTASLPAMIERWKS